MSKGAPAAVTPEPVSPGFPVQDHSNSGLISPAGVGLVTHPLLKWALLHCKGGRMGQELGSFDSAASAGAARPESD